MLCLKYSKHLNFIPLLIVLFDSDFLDVGVLGNQCKIITTFATILNYIRLSYLTPLKKCVDKTDQKLK